jgi:RNA polymerase sigma-70 factor (ECF subfamily)
MHISPDENTDSLSSWNNLEDLESVFRQWYPSLCHVTYKIIRDKETAEDIVQDVFVKMWENRKNLKINISIKSYLYRSCINTALNETARQKKYTKVPAEGAIIIASQNTAENIELEDLHKKIDEGIGLLPPACKSVFILSRFEEMSYKEIAGTLDISVKTVENQMGKALQILREHLKDYLILLILFFLSPIIH